MDTREVMSALYDVIDEIKESKEYLDLKEAYNTLINDKEASILIKDFDNLKEIYNKFKTKENSSKLSEAKKALYSNELYNDYSNKLLIYNNKISKLEEEINNALFSSKLKEFKDLWCLNGECKK